MRATTAKLARSWRRTTPLRVSGDPADPAGVLGGVDALIAEPHAEELWHCAKTSKG
jgi:hypothetical protein